jgi:hypothetical protein
LFVKEKKEEIVEVKEDVNMDVTWVFKASMDKLETFDSTENFRAKLKDSRAQVKVLNK